MAEFDAVLIYDGDCPFCSAAATALRRTRDVGVVAWHEDAAQSFLEAQFEDVPFVLAFVDREAGSVYVGRDAAQTLCDRAGLPVLVRDIVGDNYESLADAIRTVTGLEREPDPYHGEYPLTDAATDRIADLDEAAEPGRPSALR